MILRPAFGVGTVKYSDTWWDRAGAGLAWPRDVCEDGARIERIMPLSAAAEADCLVETSSSLGKTILDPTLG